MIVSGAMLFSILTVTPLMAAHTSQAWQWTAPILPLVVDAAVVIVVRLDSVLARLGGRGGRWPAVLRWMTGVMTVALNIGQSALKRDLVGVAVHAVAPLLLIVTSETGLAYRRAITAAVERLRDREQAERERIEKQAADAARQAKEDREREQDRAERLERERAEREREQQREAREHAAALRREEWERQDARERAERAERERAEEVREQQRREREHREQQEAERRERERREREERAAREREERAGRERAEREREQQRVGRERRERQEAEQREQEAALQRARAIVAAAEAVTDKLPEDAARETVAAAHLLGLSTRAAADLTGWSVGWVATRYQDLRDDLEGAAA